MSEPLLANVFFFCNLPEKKESKNTVADGMFWKMSSFSTMPQKQTMVFWTYLQTNVMEWTWKYIYSTSVLKDSFEILYLSISIFC